MPGACWGTRFFRIRGTHPCRITCSSINPLEHVLAQAALANYHRQGDLYTRHLFLTVRVAESPRSEPAWLGSGECPLPGLLCPHMADRRGLGVSPSSSEDTSPIMGTPTFHDLIKPTCLPEVIQHVNHIQTYELAGGRG